MTDYINPFAVDASLRTHLTEALIAQGGINHAGLNAYLRKVLPGHDFAAGALLTDPVIEAAADYLSSGKRPDELDTLFSLATRKALLGQAGDNHRFDYPAYEHQLASWWALSHDKRRSLLVASGTGSGKTECFMVPMLDDLVRESEAMGSLPLVGVRALMLYPLNALIASQRERIDRWTQPFGSRIRYGLYNGLMTKGREHDIRRAQAESPNEVVYRNDLRKNPPPILVTNNTMLEYMTIRSEDRPILDASAGKLRWIIVDEAHSYIGSSAAELSLLLRRVLQAFEVKASDVRFVATSATIGSEDEEGRATLQRFWADIAGLSTNSVDVVFGKREPFRFPAEGSNDANVAVAALPHVPSEKRYQVAKSLAERLRQGPEQKQQASEVIGGDCTDLLQIFAGKGVAKPILPMRVHKFLRAVPGLWSCLSPDCTGARPNGWPFGALSFERTEVCPFCSCKVFELQSCTDCGEPMLLANERDGILSMPMPRWAADDFSDAEAQDIEKPDNDAEPSDDGIRETASLGTNRLIAGRAVNGAVKLGVDFHTGQLSDHSSDSGVWVAQLEVDHCPICSAKAHQGRGPYWPWRFGTPFLLQNAAPLMIDGVSPMPKPHERELPNEGRQLISFTDSRQGTARMAARIETQSERSFVRAFVYHSVQKAGADIRGNSAARENLEQAIVQLKTANVTGVAIDSLQEQLASLGENSKGRVAWKSMATQLSQSPVLSNTISSVWDNDREAQYHNHPDRLANFLLLRELGRRPRRANTIETMGLARFSFPTIEKVTENKLPSSFRTARRSISDWKDYLYFIIDQLRGAFAIRMSREDQHWLPGKAFAIQVVGPNQDKRNKSDYVWPKAKGSGNETNAVKALAQGLGLDPVNAEDRHVINETLHAAWDALRDLLSSGDSYALDLTVADIEQVMEGWQCPVSRRIVPRLVFGRSPNMIANQPVEGEARPRLVRFPEIPVQFPHTSDEKVSIARFTEIDPIVETLRIEGLWTALHDRVALGAPFVRAEEHSAQQPPWRLRDFERQFKLGEINMLACSTTMEMGVDIGSIEAVINTNVPPSIANYRQRVGRAGRRRQGYAFSLTIAKDTPLDRETLLDPKAYLGKQLRAPKVTLESRPIVQRHANGLLLARWLAKDGGQLHRIQAGDFFGCRADLLSVPENEKSPCSNFIEWLNLPSTKSEMQVKLDDLTRGTVLQGDDRILQTASFAFEAESAKFAVVWQSFCDQMQQVATEAKDAVRYQAKRVCQEYLLKELANRALIPGSGFPTAVVPFVTSCAFNRRPASTKADEEGGARGNRYDYPSRNADIAIREYAPGAHVVVDGLLWTSAGVSLTWKRPADSEDVREAQSFKRHWKCGKCGEHGNGHGMQVQCPSCGNEALASMEYLEPVGFKVDWSANPNADTDSAVYIEPEEPLISASESDWQPLLDPQAGRYRSSPVGKVFHQSKGPGRSFYDLCLDCGRAAPHSDSGADPLAGHDALTPLKGKPGLCTGNDRSFAIKRSIALGFEIQTDVTELQLTGVSTQGSALALASAIREALTQMIGIEARALGLGAQKMTGSFGQPCWSLMLYDQASGGAGYAPRAFEDISALLLAARNILDCDRNCENACSACVLAPDLFAKQEILDRRDALRVIDETLTIISEPSADDLAFPDALLSRSVADDLVTQMPLIDRFILVMDSSFDLSALNTDPFRTMFMQADRYGVRRALLLPKNLAQKTDDAFKRGLQKIAHRFELELLAGEVDAAQNGAICIAIKEMAEVSKAYFSRDTEAAVPSARWGNGDSHPIVITKMPESIIADPFADSVFEFVTTPHSSVRHIDAGQGSSSAMIGKLITDKNLRPVLEEVAMWLPGHLIRLEYSDKYLKAPLPMLCAFRTFAELKNLLCETHLKLPLKLICDQASNDRFPSRIFHNWRSYEEQDATAVCLADALGLDLTIADEHAPHGRKLSLFFKNGRTVSCYFDQGFGQWQVTGNAAFNFHATADVQAKEMLALKSYISADGESYIAVRAQKP